MTENMIRDSNALGQYIDLMGEEGADFIIEIIDTFLEEAPENFKILDECYNNSNFGTFRRAAHTLKTGCSIVGATNLAEKFLILEEAGVSENILSVDQLLLGCKADFELLTMELEERKTALR